MFEELTIKGFRCHKNLSLKLEPITCIRGASGRGKTAILGALKFVCLNQPQGTDFINWDSDGCRVDLAFDGGKKLTRLRNSNKNYYRFEGQVFNFDKSSRTGVPTKVSSVLSVTQLHFQKQHAGPYWFSESAGKVAKLLNRVVNLDIIDYVFQNLDKKQRANTTLLRDRKARVKAAKSLRKSLQYIREFDQTVLKLEHLSAEIEETAENAVQLTKRHVRVLWLRLQRERASVAASALDSAILAGESWLVEAEKLDRLEYLVHKAELEQEILETPIPDLTTVTEAYEQLVAAQERVDTLETLIEKAWSAKEELEQAQAKAAQAGNAFDDLFKKQKRCPLCQRKL